MKKPKKKVVKKPAAKQVKKSVRKKMKTRSLIADDAGFIRRVKKTIPFEFVLENLEDLNVHTKPMFGAFGVYLQNKIVFILRERPTSVEDNGVWLATTPEHHQSLQKEFPNMRSLLIFGPGVTGWQVLPVEADDFEESVLRACELVRLGDERIGKIPKVKLRKKK